ncbi:MAG: TIGR02206 family membrane protein [Anaerolineales bacterium]|nr:TIGR02206 family membrane protein [Anaerolineales bacterium]
MGQFFAKDYTGGAFELYGAGHITALVIITFICLSLLYFRKVWGEKEKKFFRYFLAIVLVIDELSWHAWAAYWGLWNIRFMLPLHLCSICLWLSVYMLFTRNYTIYELVYFLGIGGATQALLTPDASQYGFPHFRAFQTFIGHGLLVIIPIYMTIVEGYRPTLQSFKRVFIWTNIYMIPVFFLNLALGSNYLFIHYKPNFPTLLDLLAPWPWYVLELEVVGFAIISLLYIPFLLKDWKAKQPPLTNLRRDLR